MAAWIVPDRAAVWPNGLKGSDLKMWAEVVTEHHSPMPASTVALEQDYTPNPDSSLDE